MTSNSEINLGFLKQESDQIDYDEIEVVPDLIYDFHFDSKDLVSIMEILIELPLEFCILCRIKFIMGNNASVRLLFTEEYLQFASDSKLKTIDVNDTHYLLYGTLKQSISTLSPHFIRTLKEDKMVGVCCISVQLLRRKITTWIDEKGDLSRVITTKFFSDSLHQHLPETNLLDLRLVSRDAKEMVVFKRPETIFEQSKLPDDFDYTKKSFEDLCNDTYGKKIKNYGLNILFGINFVLVKGERIVIIKIFDTEGNEIKLVDHKVLTQPHIKLSIEIICDNDNNTPIENEKIFSSLYSIIGNLKTTIYSLVVDFQGNTLIREDYNKFAKVLTEIPNLTILKLSDVYIQWKTFLSCIKSIKKLEELDLTDIRMMTNLSDRTADPEDFDKINFMTIFCDSLKHLKGIRIAGDDCFVIDTRKRQNGDFFKYHLFDILTYCLESFTNLKSLGFNYNKQLTRKFINMLQHCKNITRLDLSGSDLREGMDKMTDMSHIIMGLLNLKELDLSECELSMENLNNKFLRRIWMGTPKSLSELYDMSEDLGSDTISIMELLTLRKIRVLIISEEDGEWYDVDE